MPEPNPIKPMSADDKHCLKCFYHFRCGDLVCCEFILVTGQRRGCPPGLKCKRYLKGDPKVRYGLPPELELEPGLIPGARDQKQTKGRLRTRVPLNEDAYNLLRKEHTARELAELTGTSTALWRDMRSVGKINPTLAKTIYEQLGVDLIAR